MRQRNLAVLCAAAAVVALVPALAAGQAEVPRTPWGAPDIGGIWNSSTVTPLQRPESLGDQAFLTEPPRQVSNTLYFQ